MTNQDKNRETATIEIFSGPQCGFCQQAKALLHANGLTYEDRDISHEGHRAELIRRLPRAKAIPQIFIDGEHIGGYEDLRLLASDGRLERITRAG